MVYEDFDEAQAAAQDQDRIVCGTLTHEGEPRYYLMAPDASDEAIRDRGFEIREGRPPSRYEHWLLEVARAEAS